MVCDKKVNYIKALKWMLSLLLSMLFVVACNITYKVRNQQHEIASIFHTPCGNITFELIGKGNSTFLCRQKFDISQDLTIHLDSLKVYLNAKKVALRHKLNNEELDEYEVEAHEHDLVETSFLLDKGVFEGDTIRIYGIAYLLCNDVSISLDTLTYSFTNRLRIYGIND